MMTIMLLGQFKCHDDDDAEAKEEEGGEEEGDNDLMLSPSLTRTFCCSVTNSGRTASSPSVGDPATRRKIQIFDNFKADFMTLDETCA